MVITEGEWLLIDAWRALRRRRTACLAALALLGALTFAPTVRASPGLVASRAGLPSCDVALALPAGHWVVLCAEEGR